MIPIPASSRFAGVAAEYNGKFMVGQVVLRGGSVATPPGHIRSTYRNFFPPQARWQFSAAFAWRRTSDGHATRPHTRQHAGSRRLCPGPDGWAGQIAQADQRKYFYDAAGSRLFDQICELPEYYQTRTETALLRRHAPRNRRADGSAMPRSWNSAPARLRKVRILLDAAQPRAYLPLDISGDYLRHVVRDLAVDYPALQVAPVVADFTLPLEIPGDARRAGFFPGSTIGNFRPDAAMALAARACAAR